MRGDSQVHLTIVDTFVSEEDRKFAVEGVYAGLMYQLSRKSCQHLFC